MIGVGFDFLRTCILYACGTMKVIKLGAYSLPTALRTKERKELFVSVSVNKKTTFWVTNVKEISLMSN